MKFYYSISILFFGALPLFGQGSFLVETYSYQDYGGHRQNWSITQDSTGSMFFGNNNSLIWFDGVEWHDQHISNNTIIRSLFTSSEGHLYFGTVGDFGKIEKTEVGELTYQSFKTLIPDSISFETIFQIEEFKSAIYFLSREYIFIYDGEKVSIIDSESAFSQLSHSGEYVFVRLVGDGVYRIVDDSLEAIPDGSYFSDNQFFTAEKINDKYLFTTIYSGLTIFDGTKIERLNNALSDFLAKSGLYRSERINDDYIGFATLTAGVVIAKTSDWSFEVFDESKGLSNNQVYEIYVDAEGVLWVTGDNGISKILVNQPILSINELSGLPGNIIQLIEQEEFIYVATTNQLYAWNKENSQLIELPIYFPTSLSESNGQVFTSSAVGVHKLKGSTVELISDKADLSNIEYIVSDTLELIAGINDQGLFLYELNNRTEEMKFTRLESIESLFDLKFYQNSIWAISQWGGVVQFDLNKNEIHNFDLNIPEGFMSRSIGVYNGNITIGTDAGLYSIINNQVHRKEEINSLFEEGEDNSKQFFRFESCKGQLFVFYNRQIYRFDGDQVYDSPYQLVGEEEEINTIHCTNDEIWFGGNAGIYILGDTTWDYKTDFQTNITRLIVNTDSLIYGGFGEPNEEIILPYSENALRFNYAASSYINPERNTYSYKLEGFDSDWSEWSLESKKDYTNIPEGEYIFQVKSRNVYGVEGSTDSFAFTILPPWYRTWWAYVLYLISFSALMYSAYKIRVNQLLKVERMRTKIASDLHDEVSATLTGISYFAEAVKTDIDVSKKDHFMNLITESAGDAKEKITDIVWSITPENDDWLIFLTKCRRYATDLVESRGLEHDFRIAEHIPAKLTMNVRQHLWMIFKEIITNAVRHSNATRIDLIMDVEQGIFKMIIQDNGDGFDVSSKVFGNGLKNIKNRAHLIKATLELDSEIEMGTRWRLEMKL